MKHLSALLLAAGTAALPACSEKSDANPGPAPATETSMQRELRYPQTPSAASSDTVVVVRTGYEAKDIKATAIAPAAAMSSYMGLQLVLEVADQAQQLRITIPSPKLSPNWTGQYPFELYSIGRASAGGSYLVGQTLGRPLIDTYLNTLSSGTVSITKYDAHSRLLSGTFSLRQVSVSDPSALAGLPEPLRKKCTVVLTGSFANLPVQQ
jgi:hypothetical protein